MRTVRVIPCLDVDAGRVVKGVRFTDLFDAGDPVELAARYDRRAPTSSSSSTSRPRPTHRADHGRRGRPYRRGRLHPLHRRRRGALGRRRPRLLRAGADKVGVNTAAVDRPGLLDRAHRRVRRQCVVVAIDARRRPNESAGGTGWEVFTHGGRRATGSTPWPGRSGARASVPASCSSPSIDRDGTSDGFDLELTRLIADRCRVPVVARVAGRRSRPSGRGAVDGGADAVLAASIFHLGELTVGEAKAYLASAGITVRPV